MRLAEVGQGQGARLGGRLTRSPEAALCISTFVFSLAVYGTACLVPPVQVFDESVYIGVAQAFAKRVLFLPDSFLPQNFEHPPGFKLALWASTSVIGDTPLGWRFVSVVSGAATVSAVSLVAFRLFNSRRLALLAAGLLLVENLHLLLAKVAVPDALANALAMGAFSLALRPDGGRMATPIVLGLAVAVKLPALFYGPIVFYLWLRSFPGGETWRSARRGATFAAASLAAFSLVYLPYVAGWSRGEGSTRPMAQLFDTWARMLDYHGHAYRNTVLNPDSANWWMMQDPWTVAAFGVGDDRFLYMVALGNVVIWWLGLVPMMIRTWVLGWRRLMGRFDARDADLAQGGFMVITLAFATVYLPFFLVQRVQYSYYAGLFVPLLAVLAAFNLCRIHQKVPLGAFLILVGAIALFVVWLPFTIGIPVPRWYLGWMP